MTFICELGFTILPLHCFAVSETSLKLVEYGEEDDEDSSAPGTPKANGTQYANGKPFWAP
jgi:hypothetical protein